MPKATAKDVAKACGTSLSAVSRAFRANAPIDRALRDRILQCAQTLGYVPPRRRRRSSSDSLGFGVFVGDIENPFYPQVLQAFSEHASERRWEMTVYVEPLDGVSETILKQILHADLDLLVIVSARMSSRLASVCREKGLPVIFFNRVQADADMHAVCSDNYLGGTLVAQRFLAAGLDRIAYLGGASDTSTHLERRKGFLDALSARQVSVAFDLKCDFKHETALETATALFARTRKPQAVFCANDNMAFAVIDAATNAELRPGRDVHIVGYDNVPMARWAGYDLTTVSQQMSDMVEATCAKMQDVKAGVARKGDVTLIPPKLIERSSG